jgi:hypothetical protein
MSALTLHPADTRAAWAAYWSDVNGESWLSAKALLELSPSLLGEAAGWVKLGRDLHEWVRAVDADGRGWSSTEARLFRIVAALIDPYPEVDSRNLPPYVVIPDPNLSDRGRRLIPLTDCLDSMGSWETEVWQILVNWGTGGNNREYRGRATMVP